MIIPVIVINMVLSLVYQYNEWTWRSWWVLCGVELNISIDYISIALNFNDVWLLFFHIAESYSYKSSDICTLSLMIGHRIREARKQRGYNQQWLAEQIGVSQPSVSDWEVRPQ